MDLYCCWFDYVLENPARAGIQMMHRIGALITTLLTITLIYSFKVYPHLRGNLTMIGSLLAMQITLGILNVVLSIPMAIATLHNTVALLLLLSVITLIHKVFKPPLRQY
jgi:cytochrome c oxidase assembly protein subunit 15